jgi:hypothetical protein
VSVRPPRHRGNIDGKTAQTTAKASKTNIGTNGRESSTSKRTSTSPASRLASTYSARFMVPVYNWCSSPASAPEELGERLWKRIRHQESLHLALSHTGALEGISAITLSMSPVANTRRRNSMVNRLLCAEYG